MLTREILQLASLAENACHTTTRDTALKKIG